MVDKFLGIITALILLTALSVVISKKSRAVQVLNAVLGNINKIQKTAISPVTG